MNVFDKLNAGFNDLPVASGPNVFLREEYQQSSGISRQYASARLKTLLGSGEVRKVRTKRDGRLVQAWEYIGSQKKKVASE